MKYNYTVTLTSIPEGYRLSINGEDYVYATLRDAQQRVAALVWPEPDTGTIEVQITYRSR